MLSLRIITQPSQTALVQLKQKDGRVNCSCLVSKGLATFEPGSFVAQTADKVDW